MLNLMSFAGIYSRVKWRLVYKNLAPVLHWSCAQYKKEHSIQSMANMNGFIRFVSFLNSIIHSLVTHYNVININIRELKTWRYTAADPEVQQKMQRRSIRSRFNEETVQAPLKFRDLSMDKIAFISICCCGSKAVF